MTGKKIEAKLSDGRDLIYFDDENSGLSQSRRQDKRAPQERPETANLRFDPLTSEWITIASHRQQRAFLPPANACPLCPSTDLNQSELPDNFDVAVFENKGPAFGPSIAEIEHPNGNVFGFSTQAHGRCEVVVFSPEHQGSLASMPEDRIQTVITAWQDRTSQLQSMPGIVQVFPFENRGEEIGVTLHHPHGQIYGYPFITPRTQKLISGIERVGPDFFEQLAEFEFASERVVLESESFVAYVPYAARWPVELHMMPKRQLPDLAALNDSETQELAGFYKKLLQGIDALYETPTPYISAWHQAPMIENRERVRLTLQITSPRRAADKLKFLAGSEAAMGAFVGDIEPEAIAGRLREVIS